MARPTRVMAALLLALLALLTVAARRADDGEPGAPCAAGDIVRQPRTRGRGGQLPRGAGRPRRRGRGRQLRPRPGVREARADRRRGARRPRSARGPGLSRRRRGTSTHDAKPGGRRGRARSWSFDPRSRVAVRAPGGVSPSRWIPGRSFATGLVAGLLAEDTVGLGGRVSPSALLQPSGSFVRWAAVARQRRARVAGSVVAGDLRACGRGAGDRDDPRQR